ncbi:MAG: hypothetical protein NVSMB19_18560 [Vulcanimicrobiaceae bacterium]
MKKRVHSLGSLSNALWQASLDPAYQPLVLRAIEPDADDIDVIVVWDFLAERVLQSGSIAV